MNLKALLARTRLAVRAWLCSRHDRSMQASYLEGLTWAEAELDRGVPPDHLLLQANGYADDDPFETFTDPYSAEFNRGAREAAWRRLNRGRIEQIKAMRD